MNKKYHNNGQSEDEIMQNRFTAYVEKALSGNRGRYYKNNILTQETEIPCNFEDEDTLNLISSAGEGKADDTYNLGMEDIDNSQLFLALGNISREDMMIIKLHVLYGLSFAAIANSMSVTCAVISSRYYRAIEKIRKGMEDKT